MAFHKVLYSVQSLVNYLHPLAQELGAKETITLYAPFTGLGPIEHVIGANQKEIDAQYEQDAGIMDGLENLGVFTLYNEYTPYSKAALTRMVKHLRESE